MKISLHSSFVIINCQNLFPALAHGMMSIPSLGNLVVVARKVYVVCKVHDLRVCHLQTLYPVAVRANVRANEVLDTLVAVCSGKIQQLLTVVGGVRLAFLQPICQSMWVSEWVTG